MNDKILEETPAARLAPSTTVKSLRAELEKTNSEFAVMANVRGDIGIVFAGLLAEQKDDESPRMVHMTFEAAKGLERTLRQVLRRVQDGKVGQKV